MIGLAAYNAYKLESEHHHHIEEHGRPPFVAYPHLRRRTKVVIVTCLVIILCFGNEIIGKFTIQSILYLNATNCAIHAVLI